jgi:uncharacterized repeat protein (TIGR01451 family)
MKISHLFNTLSKRLAAGALIALALTLVTTSAFAGAPVQISANTGVANVTAGDTSYKSSVNASYDQIVKIDVQYDNLSAPGSTLNAEGVHIKINIPSTKGLTQTVTSVTGGTNTNTVNGQAVVNINDPTGYIQYIPNSGQAAVTDTSGHVSIVAVPDSVVNSAQGYEVNNGNPCQGAAFAVEARVIVPGVKIVKQSEVLGQVNQWSNNNSANAGQTMVYMITYQNIGNSEEDNVIVRDNMPPGMSLVPGTTKLYNQSNPNGVLINSDNIASGGIVIGNYNPGAGAYVTFEMKLPAASQLACGVTQIRNVGVVRPEGLSEYYNTAITNVNNQCTTPSTPSTPTPSTTQPTALVNTGPGSVIGIFAGAAVAGAVGHYLFKSRRFARNSK